MFEFMSPLTCIVSVYVCSLLNQITESARVVCRIKIITLSIWMLYGVGERVSEWEK